MTLFGQQHTGLHDLLNRKRPTAWQQFLSQPWIFLAHKLYTWQETIPAQPLTQPVSIVCISDTHNSQPSLPEGEILIHAGDLTQSGSLSELLASVSWLREQPHPIKIVVAGNHDQLLDPSRDSNHIGQAAAAAERAKIDWGDIIYLENSETTVVCANGRRLRIYGRPLSPRHGDWAFQYPRNQDVWTEMIPEGIDVLVTHGPPRAHLDLLKLGCVHLLRALWRTRPWLHVFGHVHEGAGTEWLLFDSLQEAYERTVVDGGGFGNLLRTVWAFMRSLRRPAVEAKCLLVNASMVGGLRNDERRQPIMVTI